MLKKVAGAFSIWLGCGEGEKEILSDFGSQNYFGAGR
jgi:hypothetical protein